MEQPPGNLVLGLYIEAEAEVIPAENAEVLWSTEDAQQRAIITPEHGPELVHFEENNK